MRNGNFRNEEVIQNVKIKQHNSNQIITREPEELLCFDLDSEVRTSEPSPRGQNMPECTQAEKARGTSALTLKNVAALREKTIPKAFFEA